MNKLRVYNRISIRVLTLILTCITLAACNTNSAEISFTPTFAPPTQVYSIDSYIKAFSIHELTEKATIIVLGKATRVGEIFNMARDPQNLNNPDPRLFGIGQVYEFEVERYLKNENTANGETIIHYVQAEGMIRLETGLTITDDIIEKARAQEEFFTVRLGNQYILFLKPIQWFPEKKNHYSGIAHPWRFLVYEGCVYPETPWESADHYFWPTPFDKFIEQVEQSVISDAPIPKPEWSPNPPPLDPLCEPYPGESEALPLSGTPYP